jgi:hypothetical protein
MFFVYNILLLFAGYIIFSLIIISFDNNFENIAENEICFFKKDYLIYELIEYL